MKEKGWALVGTDTFDLGHLEFEVLKMPGGSWECGYDAEETAHPWRC